MTTLYSPRQSVDEPATPPPEPAGRRFARGFAFGLVSWGLFLGGFGVAFRDHVDARRLVVGTVAVLALSACVGLRVVCLTGQTRALRRLGIGALIGVLIGVCIGLTIALLVWPPPAPIPLPLVAATAGFAALGSALRALSEDT